ncbi:FadR/GntR family transcriptional regulator [Bosea sp. (in: a-proteobacteria)]|uniref:FadR/GntR family transcriptional regulator n=1 Tax=Bosea sp. (in: a-proteobacteria) TaxID=1871050 RepID=UPI003B3B1781
MTARIVSIPARRGHSNHAEIARSIGIDIITGRYGEGAKLPGDAELTLAFRVSRPVLREAVKTLVAKGLLSTKARVGTVVRSRSAWNMFDSDVLAWHLDAGIDRSFVVAIAEIRQAIEPRAASLAAQRRTEADLDAMRAAIEQMRVAAEQQTAAFAEADVALHVAVANAAGNPFIRSIGAMIEAALRASFEFSAPSDEADYAFTIASHQRIVDAIAARDPASAADAMTHVIAYGLKRPAPKS